MRELFTKIELADREAMTPYLSAFRFVDLGFTGLYYCAEAFDIRKAYLCGALCLRIRGEDGYAYVLSDVKKLPEIAELLFASEGTNAIAFDFVKREDLPIYTSFSPYASSVACEEKYADYFSTYADYVLVDKQKALHKYKDYHQFCSRYAHAAYALSKETLPVAAKLPQAVTYCRRSGRGCQAGARSPGYTVSSAATVEPAPVAAIVHGDCAPRTPPRGASGPSSSSPTASSPQAAPRPSRAPAERRRLRVFCACDI